MTPRCREASPGGSGANCKNAVKFVLETFPELGVVAHACNTSTWEVKAIALGIQGQPGLQEMRFCLKIVKRKNLKAFLSGV